jgi:quercetin dioxygenase-like cupin family protein
MALTIVHEVAAATVHQKGPLDGEDLQANLVRLGVGDQIQPHRNDEVDVVVVVVSGRGELTLGGQVHPLAPMALVHLPKGTVRAMVAVDGPLATCRSTAAARRACRSGGPPSDAEAPRLRPSPTPTRTWAGGGTRSPAPWWL